MILTRGQLEEMMWPQGATPPQGSKSLDLGCVGLTCIYQQGVDGKNIWPENVPGTKCWHGGGAEAMARSRECDKCERNFVFAKQGESSHALVPPEPDPDGKGAWPMNASVIDGEHWNYVTVFPGTYAWMDHGIEDGPQTACLSPNRPKVPDEWKWIEVWCSTCIKK
jgi:hypothetical protein